MMEHDVVSSGSCNMSSGCSAHSSPLTSSNSVNLSPAVPEKTFVKSAGKENNFPDFSSLYHSLLSEQTMHVSPPSTDSPPISSGPSATTTSEMDEAIATENRLYQARLIIESHLYQDLLNRYGIALTQIHDLAKETKSLLEENEVLRLGNEELTRRLSWFLQFSRSALLGVSSSLLSPAEDLHRNSIITTARDMDHEIRNDAAFSSNNGPTSVIDGNRSENRGVERVSLPKSISVRSSGYLKINQPTSNLDAGGSRAASSHPRVRSQIVDAARVYVKREEKAVEMEVYNQGMYKTELCNKWQETGACSYGDQCQFAHGLSELRPVLRHPRYKTEVCRMMVAGLSCPYGHRCHFRHSPSDRVNLMTPQ